MPARTRLLIGHSDSVRPLLISDFANAPTGRVWWIVPTTSHVVALGELPEHVRGMTLYQAAARSGPAADETTLLTDWQRRYLVAHLLAGRSQSGRTRLLSDPAGSSGTTEAVAATLEELRELDVNAEEFARFAAETSPGPARAQLDREVSELLAGYGEALGRYGLIDSLELFRRATRPPKLASVVIDGFVQFRPTELAFLKRLVDSAGVGVILLPVDPEHPCGPGELYSRLHEAFPKLEDEYPEPPGEDRPAGLMHLSRWLFDETAIPADDSSGVAFIDGPGVVGECRMVARAIVRRLRDGTPPERILVTARSLTGYELILPETLSEYGIPFAMDRRTRFDRIPAIVAALRAARLPEQSWPFGGVAALLRCGWFRPSWPEFDGERRALEADLLLRELNVPRDRDAYLAAVRQWAEAPPKPLEDESAEFSLRRRRHELAKGCRPLLERFFAAWDAAPESGPWDAHVDWLRQWSADLGFPAEDPDLTAWWAWLDEVHTFTARFSDGRALRRGEFLDRLDRLARIGFASRGPDAGTGVRVLPADVAAGLAFDHVFIIGLDEGAFPSLAAGVGLYSEIEREEFRGVGLDLRLAAERLPAERLLFHRIIGQAARSVTLSRPATDHRGQERLPASFLRDVQRLLPDAPTESRTMLIDGFDTDEPLSPAEVRVRYAATGAGEPPDDVRKQLGHWARVVKARFRDKEYTSYDGLLSARAARDAVAERFGPRKKFSATSLEDYVACPFKFFGRHVLRFAPLRVPGDEVAAHERGSAFHRALARLEKQNAPQPGLRDRLAETLRDAVRQELDRSPSPINRRLWELELLRWSRSVDRYPSQWESYRKHWDDVGLPRFIGAEREYMVELGSEESPVVIHGRIDRIDLVESPSGVGLAVVDYKTGRTGSYTAKAVASMEKLQLGVYGLAAERLYAGATPLALLYWLPTDKGPHGYVPKAASDWLSGEGWAGYRDRLVAWLTAIAERIRSANFIVSPRTDKSCEYCDYHRLCRIAQTRNLSKPGALELPIDGGSDE
jgi:ATP-dependent helicase/DNAse subunit B